MGLSLSTQQSVRSFLGSLRGAKKKVKNQKCLLLPWRQTDPSSTSFQLELGKLSHLPK